ncbi:glutaredoxin domain-containing protein [Desulfurispira natronophila]|uniref:Glutaredoxin 3 n=1 Tax=Desulfurispira natronophila TaxID=682562 RepID=A0A7W7Y4B7_9BACT|nr:glutaredoxin domain-containing protein [Desulfurispira natronophila]MBB5021788.1 glutaredoxin 3 [Desulfurispira natronophila]
MQSVTIYTKNSCPFCRKAKALLDSLGVRYEEHEVTFDPALYASIKKRTGMNTVPQVLVGDDCLGGFSEIDALHREGKLLPLIRDEQV